jgi:hypothetical protein
MRKKPDPLEGVGLLSFPDPCPVRDLQIEEFHPLLYGVQEDT